MWIVTRIHVQQLIEAAAQQTGSDDEQKGTSDLYCHQHASHLPGSTAAAEISVAVQHLVQVHPPGSECWRQPEKDSAGKRGRQG